MKMKGASRGNRYAFYSSLMSLSSSLISGREGM
jgi:hypothetical protein